MSLILAIEPDRRQASKLTALARGPLNVDMVVGETTERAFQALGGRVPDLVLTSLLLSPKDEAALADRLRELDATGAHVQTLVIPVLGTGEAVSRPSGGLFSRLRKASDPAHRVGGCDPAVFGDQILEYLERAAAERAALAVAQADLDAAWADEAAARDLAAADDAMTAPLLPPTPEPVDAFLESSFDVPSSVESSLEVASSGETDLEVALSIEPDVEVASAPIPAAPQHDQSSWTALLASSEIAAHGDMSADDEWEEISLDDDRDTQPAADIDAEAVDLDAFVRQLHADGLTAGDEPAIPTVDLGVLSVGADEDLALWATAEVPLSGTQDIDTGLELDSVAAAFEVPAVSPSYVQFEAEPLDAMTGLDELFEPRLNEERPATQSELPSFTQDALPPRVPTAWATTSSVPMEAMTVAAAPAPMSWSSWSEPASASPASPELPPSGPLPMASAAMLGSGWQDVLSAIRRDIHQVRKDETPPASTSRPAQLPSLTFELPTGRWPGAQSSDTTPMELAEVGAIGEAPEEVAPAPTTTAATPLPTLATLEAALSATLEVRMPLPATAVEAPTRAPVAGSTPGILDASRAATVESSAAFVPVPTLEQAEAAISAALFQGKSSEPIGKSSEPIVPAVVSSWGFFDPQRVELSALLAKLNELSPDPSRSVRPG